MGSRHRPGTAPGAANDRPSTLCAPAGDPTPITQVKVCTRAKSITGFSLSKPVPGFKIGYQFTGSRLTSLDWMPFLPPNQQRQSTEGHSLGYKNSCTHVTCCEGIAKKLFEEHFFYNYSHTMFHTYKLLQVEVRKFFSSSSLPPSASLHCKYQDYLGSYT